MWMVPMEIIMMTLDTTSIVRPQKCMQPITSTRVIVTQTITIILPQISARRINIVPNTAAIDKPTLRYSSSLITCIKIKLKVWCKKVSKFGCQILKNHIEIGYISLLQKNYCKISVTLHHCIIVTLYFLSNFS